MSSHQEEPSRSAVQQDVKSVKPKNQNAKRQFGCPCGKEYLSYPALFTHIKQKHGGKAPGDIKKPKTQKARGRPRLPTVNMQEDNSVEQYDPHEQLNKVLSGKTIKYNQQFQESDGTKSCQDMASHFLKEHGEQQEHRKILTCFVNYLKFYITNKNGAQYWQQTGPQDIIDISNFIVRQLDDNKERFPLTRQLLVELLFILFRWMYKQKWTDHKLVRRTQENSTSQNAAT